jgi:hypothetical protein
MGVVSRSMSSNSLRKILVSIMIITVLAALNNLSYAKISYSQMGHGHNLPSATWGIGRHY